MQVLVQIAFYNIKTTKKGAFKKKKKKKKANTNGIRRKQNSFI